MFCTIIIPTIGRSTLNRAVESILSQEFEADDFEVIVVNDSEKPLPEAVWQSSPQVQLINTNQHERSIARNTGAAVAKGRYLHFLDDDDWMAPNALLHYWNLAQESRAVWLYGSSQLVDSAGEPTRQLHHRLQGNSFVQVMAGEWIPLQASIIEASTFFKIGGFNPHISGPEDIDLLRRIALRHDIAGTEAIVAYIVRCESGSTTDYDRHPQQSRWAREEVLESPGVFGRMRSSADSSYWHGRIARTYLTSVVWNVQNTRVFTAVSRLTYGVISIILAGGNVFAQNFWRALTAPYESKSYV